MISSGGQAHSQPMPDSSYPMRWECDCGQPPMLLATYDRRGRIHIKARDRYWHVDGVVRAICPRCGTEHTLDLRGEKSDRQS